MYIGDVLRKEKKVYIVYPIDNIIFNIGYPIEKTLLSIGYKICSIYSYVNNKHMFNKLICSIIHMSNIHICKYIHMYNMHICKISSYENRCIIYTLERDFIPLERDFNNKKVLSLSSVSLLLKGIQRHIYSGTIMFIKEGINPIAKENDKSL